MQVDGQGVRISDFLAVETRQVWALRRDTEEPVYLPVGAAKEMRAQARADLMCPYPGCDAEISTRGGSRRDGFFHLKAAGHDTGFESEAHLAGKAMLAAWAEGRKPDGAVVQVEASVKTNKSRSLRRPDVMVLGAHGGRVAYEVEYKNFAIDAWRAKQDEYEAEGIACAWLIGHSRLRLAQGYGARDTDAPVVLLPSLAAAIAADGVPLYAINPTTRQIGTLAAGARGDTPYRGQGTAAVLHVDALDDCRFDRRLGLHTPTMARLLVKEARLAEEEARHRAALEAHEAAVTAQRQRWQDAWESTLLYSQVVERCGGVVPEIFTVDLGRETGLAATPAHWRAVIYASLMDGRTETVRHEDFRRVLREAGIRYEPSGSRYTTDPAAVAVGRWLGHLERQGVVALTRKRQYRRSSIVATHPNGYRLEDIAFPKPRTKAEHRERLDELASTARTRLVITEDGKRRWVRK